MDEACGVLEEAAARVGSAEVLAGDIAISVMGPSIGVVTEVLEEALNALLADGKPLVYTVTLSEG
jgi:hypothetical protein